MVFIKKKIFITYVNQNRYSYASHDINMPSRFINELPKNLIDFNDSSYFSESKYMEEFIHDNDISNEYLTPGKKRLIENSKKDLIDWDINQDSELDKIFQKGKRVFHQKFGYGKILYIEGDKAKIDFEKSSSKTIFIRFLQITH